MMRNIVLKLAFDGKEYHGWQRQKNVMTVQQALEDALSRIYAQKITLSGCSRTDAGVHAREYYCNFFAEGKGIPCEKLPYAVNIEIPRSITVLEAKEAPQKFNTRFSNRGKEYTYEIWTANHQNPFLVGYAWHYPKKLDQEKMREGAKALIGEHDFRAFMAQGSKAKTTIRTVEYIYIEEEGQKLRIRIFANGFLYNMVRIICGTLVYVGNGKMQPREVSNIVKSLDRLRAGPTAPPDGLYLSRVDYSHWGL